MGRDRVMSRGMLLVTMTRTMMVLFIMRVELLMETPMKLFVMLDSSSVDVGIC